MTFKLSGFYQNVRGLRTKTVHVSNAIKSSTYDFLCLTETWLCDGIHNAECFGNSYEVYRRDRCARTSDKATGGGVLFAFRNHLQVNRLSHLETDCEDLWLSMSLADGQNLLICVVYIPPNTDY